jgi:predicted nucleic acid-binding protein
MVLVDTSVWVKHLREGEPLLAEILSSDSILTHPFVIGELACGTMRNRAGVMEDLAALPGAAVATDQEALRLIEDHKLWGRGLGWIDVHLMASALLSNCRIWTMDRRLAAAAEQAGVRRFR